MGKDWSKDKRAWKMGKDIEAHKFKQVLSLIDPNIKRATSWEDQRSHIDYHTMFGTVDVKAMKRVARSGNKQTEYLWVEFRNVQGMNGWLYGEQDWIALEKENGFLFVKRNDLKELAIRKCDAKSYVESPKDALYKMYSRSDADDVISMIKYSDLDEIPSFFVRDVGRSKDSTFL